MTVELKNETPMVKVGAGYEKFEKYISQHERVHQKKLVVMMANNQMSLE
jgi:hypothetical protein